MKSSASISDNFCVAGQIKYTYGQASQQTPQPGMLDVCTIFNGGKGGGGQGGGVGSQVVRGSCPVDYCSRTDFCVYCVKIGRGPTLIEIKTKEHRLIQQSAVN